MPTGDIELPKDAPPPLKVSGPPSRRPFFFNAPPPLPPGTPELPKEAPKRPLGKDPVGDFVDLLKGMVVGSDPDSSSAQLGGEVLGAAVPFVGATKGLLRGGQTAEEALQGIRAYHGSPHDFDKFDLSKIGTGEGGQAFGHGLYFAGNEDVARSYRDSLSSKWRYDGQPIVGGAASNALEYVDQKIAREQGGPAAMEDALRRLDKQAEFYRQTYDPGPTNLYTHAADRLRQLDPSKLSTPGHMYEVNLNVDPKQLLDFDAPLHEQPHVVDALRGAGFKNFEPMYRQPLIGGIPDPGGLQSTTKPGLRLGPYFSGNRAYESLTDLAGSSDKASQLLREAGVPGLKYLDQFSRFGKSNTPTSNYVMFRDDLIDILRKYGILLPAAGLGGAAAAQGAAAPASPPTRRPFQQGAP